MDAAELTNDQLLREDINDGKYPELKKKMMGLKNVYYGSLLKEKGKKTRIESKQKAEELTAQNALKKMSESDFLIL